MGHKLGFWTFLPCLQRLRYYTKKQFVKICSISLLGWSNIWPKDDDWLHKAKVWNENWSK